MIGSSTRSRQTRTREQALESSLQSTNKRIRAMEQRFEELVLDVHTDNVVRAIQGAADVGRRQPDASQPYMRLVSKDNGSEG